MADDGDYELLPHEEIQKLRNELNKLKKNPLGTTVQAKDLQTSVTELTKAINSLTTLLTDTNEDMTQEFQKTSISEHFVQISTQNEQIAQGILTVAKMIQEMNSPKQPEEPLQNTPSNVQVNTVPSQESQPAGQPSTPSTMPSPSQDSPSSMMPPPMQSIPLPMQSSNSRGLSMPPPALDLPPAPKKKSGLMGIFK